MGPASHCSNSDSCTTRHADNKFDSKALASLLPLAAAFVLVDVLVVRHIFPRLNGGHDQHLDGEDHYLPSHAPPALRQVHAEHGRKNWRRRGAAWTFGTTVSLAVMLGLLILGDMVEAVDPAAKKLALRVTVPSLLFLLIGVVPWLQCGAIVTSAGWGFARGGGGGTKGAVSRTAWALQLVLFVAWLSAFWSIGSTVPDAGRTELRGRAGEPDAAETLARGCLERIGVVGICLMALLAGFASVSTPWHTLVQEPSRRRRPVTEADLNRKQAGLEASGEMLAAKRHQLRRLEQRALDAAGSAADGGRPPGLGLVGKMMGTFRGASAAEAEMRALRVEMAGLEAVEANLASHLWRMRDQRAAAARSSTLAGRLARVPSQALAAYCLYRISATVVSAARRLLRSAPAPTTGFAAADPVSRFLGLVARHWDPDLDQAVWSRTISFTLSGVVLLASANSVLQTLHLFARWTPGLLRLAQANMALAVGQITATYVISASLLLRSQLPREAGVAVAGILRGALSAAFVDRWFETWFLLGGLLTGLGIWLGRTLSPLEDEWDDFGMEEMGAKRS